METSRICTDTSTIAIFDMVALKHRIDSDCDWWTYEGFPEYQEEIKNRNLILIDTKADGCFDVSVSKANEEGDLKVNCPSGSLYIVCGEEIPSEGLVPELLRGGILYSVSPGLVSVSFEQMGSKINIWINS